MGYQVGKLVSENENLVYSISSLKKLFISRVKTIQVCFHPNYNEIWFRLGREVLQRIDIKMVEKILRYNQILHVEGGGVFICPKTLKEMHDEIVYADDYLAGSEEFYFVSLFQYLFSIAPSILDRLPKNKYVDIYRRSNVKKGRKPGYILEPEPITETESETRNRIRYNKQVALKRGLYSIFEEAEKDKCRLDGVKFSKDLCVKKWNEMRGN